MNTLNRSIAGIFKIKSEAQNILCENYLINENSGSKEFYTNLIKEYDTMREARSQKLLGRIERFRLGQSLRDVISILSKQFYIIHKISDELKIVKLVRNIKSTDLKVELHFRNNILFYISYCVAEFENEIKDSMLHNILSELTDSSYFGLNQCVIDSNNNVLIPENKLLLKISLFNKNELLNYTRQQKS